MVRWCLRAPSALVVLGAIAYSAPACNAAPAPYAPSAVRQCFPQLPRCPFDDIKEYQGAECGDTSECPDDYVCEDLELTSLWSTGCLYTTACLPKCYCSTVDVCTPEGSCRPPPCDGPDAPACPAAFRCDPEAAAAGPMPAWNSVVHDDEHLLHTYAAGCVRKLCDEPGGYACAELYRCAPDESGDGSGCVPIPCAESGACPQGWTCTPAGARTRTGPDHFGCFQMNCDDEGFVCPPGHEYYPGDLASEGRDVLRVCDFSDPVADSQGCVVGTCTDPNVPCPEGLSCDPETTLFKTENGCRFPQCPDDFDCGEGNHCDAEAWSPDVHGCVGGKGADVHPPYDYPPPCD